MADSVHQLSVALSEPMTPEQAAALVQAIALLRGVAAVSVEPVSDAWAIEERVRLQIQQRIQAALRAP
ncbi:hypothetical protein D8770_00015 [Methylobacterium sp. DB1607]|nr:hypothetical protein [Methylobacterium sp. DB1607]